MGGLPVVSIRASIEVDSRRKGTVPFVPQLKLAETTGREIGKLNLPVQNLLWLWVLTWAVGISQRSSGSSVVQVVELE